MNHGHVSLHTVYQYKIELKEIEFTKNKDLARNSIRISLSYLTTKEEIDYFLTVFKEKINELRFKKGE